MDSSTMLASGVAAALFAAVFLAGARVHPLRPLFPDRRTTVSFSAGPTVGFSPGHNLWLTAGYNVTGYRDRDFSADRYTRAGPYVTMRLKFDQQSIGGAARALGIRR